VTAYSIIRLNGKTVRGAKRQAKGIAQTQFNVSPTGENWDGWKSGQQGFYWTTPAMASDARGMLVLMDHRDGRFSATFVPDGEHLD
jgi:hypothetical protein